MMTTMSTNRLSQGALNFLFFVEGSGKKKKWGGAGAGGTDPRVYYCEQIIFFSSKQITMNCFCFPLVLIIMTGSNRQYCHILVSGRFNLMRTIIRGIGFENVIDSFFVAQYRLLFLQ